MKQDSKLQTAIELLLNDAYEGMESEIVAIKSQVYQIRTLLVDAIGSLHESFEGIDGRSAEQMKLFSNMMSEIIANPDSNGSERNIFQHTENTAKVLTELLDSLIQESRKSLKVLTDMNETSAHMQKILSEGERTSELLKMLDKLLSEENPDMDQVRELSAKVSKAHEAVLEESEKGRDSCVQLKLMVGGISNRDMNKVFSSKAKVEEILDHLNQANNLISNCRTDANNVNAELKQHLGGAIRALQFEDIVSQSLGHTDLHLDRMEGFVSRLSVGLSELHEKGNLSPQEYADGVGKLHEEIMSYRSELRLEESNPVSQESMEEGDVELF